MASIEEQELDKCYICHGTDTYISPFMDPNPCLCKGSIKVHNHCLNPCVITIKSTCCICKSTFRFPDGPFTWYHPNGHVEKECTFGNNFYQGTVTYYYPDSTLRAVEQRKDGDFHGLSKFYHENGKIKSEQMYENGKRNGSFKFYFSDGTLRAEENFKNDKLHGLQKQYWENGKLRNEINYKDGLVEGYLRIYYSNGRMESKENYVRGKKHGMFKLYHENGLLASETYYENDVAKYRRTHFQLVG